MHNDTSSTPPSSGPGGSVPPVGLAPEALARRRALLKGLGKGSAVAAALVPIQTLAVPVLAGGTKQCSVSGSMSAGHSFAPGVTKDVCGGRTPAQWAAKPAAEWPSGIAPGTLFDAVFGPSPAPDTATFLECLTLAGGATTVEQVWATAYLNAAENAAFFPYSAAEVVLLFKGMHPSGVTNAQAYTFFSDFMQGGL